MRPYEATLTSIFVCEKDLGVLVGDKLNMYPHCDVTAEEEKATKLALKEAGVRLLLSRPHLEYGVNPRPCVLGRMLKDGPSLEMSGKIIRALD